MKNKYGKLGSLVWAVRMQWSCAKMSLLYSLARIPVAVALPLLQSYLTKVLLDRIGAGAAFSHLAALSTGFMLMLGLLHVLDKRLETGILGYRYHTTGIVQDDMGFFRGYQTDYENTEKQDFCEINGYAMNDACRGNCSVEFVRRDLSQTLTDLLGVFTCVSLLAFAHPALLGVVAVVSSFSYFTSRWESAYREKHKHEWEKESRKQSYVERLSQQFDHAKDVKLYGLDGWLEELMRHYQAYILMWHRRCSLRGLWAAVLAGLMTLVQDGAAYLFILALLLRCDIGVGDFVFYLGIVSSIASFLTGIIGDVAKLNERADKIAYYRQLFDYPNHFNHGEGCALPASAPEIELRNVWYRYSGAQDDTIKGLNLTIRAGESIALVGLNGAGKTTLVKLICGLYHPTRGEILVNGKPIDAYNIEEYYSLISAVFQEVHPVAFTIFAFVASCDLQRVTARNDAESALKAAGLWKKIASLPNGMDTHLMKGVYDDGFDLSGGEMQKLLLARAIYKNGSILVLDEPTAALDPIAENNIYLKYRELTQHKTSIYISHRFASTRFCDRIVLLNNGVIQESGSHDELMQLGGQYAELFNVQSQYYQEGECHA